jgi:hypothetical protein
MLGLYLLEVLFSVHRSQTLNQKSIKIGNSGKLLQQKIGMHKLWAIKMASILAITTAQFRIFPFQKISSLCPSLILLQLMRL